MKLMFAMIMMNPVLFGSGDLVFSTQDSNIPEIARSLDLGEGILIRDLYLSESEPSVEGRLTRFEVFAPDAFITRHTSAGPINMPAPGNVYLKGQLSDSPESKIMLTILESGGMRGIIQEQGRYWVLAGGAVSGGPVVGLASREFTQSDFTRWPGDYHCQADELATPGEDLPGKRLPPLPTYTVSSATYTATIALETDFEYFNLFGNATDATNYAGDLIAYSSTIYEAEVDTAMVVGSLSLWETAADPWAETSTFCGLFEFGRYWNDNNDAIARTAAHFLSGKNNGGGIAWIGVLCRGEFNSDHSGNCPGLSPNVDNYGGAYGYSGALSGSFDINNPAVVWDIVVVSHEIGHNFNSPHSHCYQDIGGNSSAVDSCYNGECNGTNCYCGATSLPGPAGTGSGTIMSYCHLLSPGLSNISMTFGLGHAFGVAAERIPTRMNDHVVSQSGIYPGCFSACNSVVILTPPDSDSSCEGENVTFSVAVSGTDPQYQWRKNSSNLIGKTASSMSINGVVAGDAGNYDCVVSNSCSSLTSAVAVLSINLPAQVQTQPVAAEACVGGSASFTVVASGTNPQYQWRKGTVNISGQNSATLLLNPVQTGDGGNYDCVVSNSCGSDSSSMVSLTVNEPVALTLQPGTQTVCPGAPASFNVSASGTGPLSYQWRKNSVNIGGATSSSYSIAVTSASDTGAYDCVITNVCGSATSQAASLDVTDLVITQQPQSQVLCLASSASLSIGVVGAGELSYQWQKNGVDLDGEISSTLEFPSATLDDQGEYTCLVGDQCRNMLSETATVTVGESLSIPDPQLVQGFSPVVLEAVICDGASWVWQNLNTLETFGANQNPVALQGPLFERTLFEVTVDTSTRSVFTGQILVLASAVSTYHDPNGDGCNTMEDFYFVLPEWNSLRPDPTGNGIFNVLDLFYINTQEPCVP